MLRLVRSLPDKSTVHPVVEDELWPIAEQARQGDNVALRTLLTALGPPLLRIVRRVLGGTHPDVEDVLQECAIELASALQRFRHECSIRHFASRVAVQTAMNARRRWRASKRSIAGVEWLDSEAALAEAPDPEAQALSRAQLELLLAFADELPPTQLEVFLLHFALGHTMAEISVICEAPLETVRSRLRAAKKQLFDRANADPRLRGHWEDLP